MIANRAIVLISALALATAAAGCEPEEQPPPQDTSWETAFDASQFGWLLSVWGPSADELTAVGGSPDVGAMMAWDGAEWAPVELGLDVPLLNWCYGFGSDDVWVVGNGGTILHETADGWSQVASPTERNLWGVWGAAPDDLWAVGGEGREAGQQTILRYDGADWTVMDVPELERPNVWAFFKVWGTASDDVYIVGQRGVVLHWDGAALEELFVGADKDLIALWGTGPDRIAAVGGRNNGIVSTWDGVEWKTASLAPMRGLNGVWMRDPDRIHVVGVNGTFAVLDFETLEPIEEFEVEEVLDMHAVFGDPSGRLTAVGGNFVMANGPYQGAAWTRLLGDSE